MGRELVHFSTCVFGCTVLKTRHNTCIQLSLYQLSIRYSIKQSLSKGTSDTHTNTFTAQQECVHFPNIHIFTAVLLQIHSACPSQWRHYKPSQYQLTTCRLTCHKITEGRNVHSLLFYVNPHINRSIQNALQYSSWYDTSPLVCHSQVYINVFNHTHTHIAL